MAIKTIEGEMQGKGLRFGIVVARFNEYITSRLLDGAVEVLKRHGVAEKAMTCVKVPGAYEIPLTLKAMAESERYDAFVAIGCVIRGATPHFDYVAGECAHGLNDVALQFGLPVGFGVLTVDTLEQAIERAGSKAGNKGADAALAAMEMANVLIQLRN